MIQLFYSAIFGEMVVILILLFNNPLRKLVVMALNRLKQGAGPLIAKTVAGVVFVMMSTTVYNIIEIHGRPVETINPTDQILHGMYVLEASLMGFLLFLSLIIDRLHHYIREFRVLRKTLEATKKQSLDEVKSGSSDKLKVLGDEISSLKAKIKQLESECESKGKEVKAAEANE
ncbi:hypothetical protein Vadar_009726 [Vaccinium darrowii]|uniref:Uncharacterized protein n=2 Tax=Vaccinium darrowii TaxID=229202 RepID=A0ACB7Z3J6_9ERIC|nr:hypothetical protein Vadar_006408 [Vaccinium darrowii]KAH7860130.1 hypothetical protein Vadar_009726 [Vaccinium darrowii]